jgi:hypothetical protein
MEFFKRRPKKAHEVAKPEHAELDAISLCTKRALTPLAESMGYEIQFEAERDKVYPAVLDYLEMLVMYKWPYPKSIAKYALAAQRVEKWQWELARRPFHSFELVTLEQLRGRAYVIEIARLTFTALLREQAATPIALTWVGGLGWKLGVEVEVN